MARRDRNQNGNRDPFEIASDPLDSLLKPVKPSRPVTNHATITNRIIPKLLEIQDNRVFHPSKPHRPPAASTHSFRSNLAVPPPSKQNKRTTLPAQVAFQAPKQVLVCIRRKTRAEVLHALKRTRAGAGSRKRRNTSSDIKC